MTCHVISQRVFWGEIRLGLLLNSTDAIAYWQKRASILAHPTGCATSCKQVSDKVMEEIVESKEELLALMSSSEGK